MTRRTVGQAVCFPEVRREQRLLQFVFLRDEFARVGERVDRIDLFVASNRFDARKAQRQSARVTRAGLNRVERDLENNLRFHFTISPVIYDRVLFKMLG